MCQRILLSPGTSFRNCQSFSPAVISKRANGRLNLEITGVRYVLSNYSIFLYSIDIFLQRNVEDILHSYYLATHFDPTWYKAWHTWALANFDVIGYMETQTQNRTPDSHRKGLVAHVVQAVDGKQDVGCHFLES